MGGVNFKNAAPYIIVVLLFILGVGINAIISAGREGPKAPGKEAVAGEYQLASSKCAECHEMWPYISTWMLSAHKKVSCDRCHTNIDLAAMEKAHAAGSYRQPIALKAPMDRGVCLGCHSGQRAPSMPGDLRDPHPAHFEAGIQCVSCHYGVTHFKINERDIFKLPDFSNPSNWRPELVKTIATLPYSRPTMQDCFNCHQTVFNPNFNPEKPMKASETPCAACHTQLTNPSQLPPAYR
ncbi:multiheme c-type cytochrome [Ammonifex degensii]|uniref:multiheme c-type cytochrome n=1 Tax=Ammonifex degensii TaxID=42838 RepID=UPI0003041235|nr:multiheme c-type cytochrome [Ammonifex degensii]